MAAFFRLMKANSWYTAMKRASLTCTKSAADQSMSALTKSTTESIFAVDYVPGTSDLIYSADKGGNEIDHLYLRKADGNVQDLTSGAQES